MSDGEPYINVGVAEQLRGDVSAAVRLGASGQVSVTVPLPAGAVGIGGCRGGVLHPCGCHNADGLA